MPSPKSLLKGFARTVDRAKPDPDKRITLFDPDTRGLCVRITSRGRKTFTVVARDPRGKQIWREVPGGDADFMPLDEARDLAREGVQRIKIGDEPFPKPEPTVKPDSVAAVVQNFLKRHVAKKGLRSAPEIERIFNRYVLPSWRTRTFIDIRRSNVTKLLDQIEDDNGPAMADRVLAAVSGLCNWYASRTDDYSSPIVRGMRRSDPNERARTRVLSHEELRLIWPVLDGRGPFGAFVKVLVLTGQRRGKVAEMRWADVSDDGTWMIPTEEREKNNPGILRLPAAVMEIIRAQAPVAGNPHVFPGRRIKGGPPIAGFAPLKRALDEAVVEANGAPLEHWTLHDLRRTARSLMSEAGVRPDIAERVLGHVIPGVEGIYDRHSYFEERAEALEKLSALLDLILNPPPENVVPMRKETL